MVTSRHTRVVDFIGISADIVACAGGDETTVEIIQRVVSCLLVDAKDIRHGLKGCRQIGVAEDVTEVVVVGRDSILVVIDSVATSFMRTRCHITGINKRRYAHIGAFVEDDGVVFARTTGIATVGGHQGADVKILASPAICAAVACHLVVEDVVADHIFTCGGYIIGRPVSVLRNIGNQIGTVAINIVKFVDIHGVRRKILHTGMDADEL